jgi:hypothetical protein
MRLIIILIFFHSNLFAQLDTLKFYSPQVINDSLQIICNQKMDSITKSIIDEELEMTFAMHWNGSEFIIIAQNGTFYQINYYKNSITMEGNIELNKQVGLWKEYYSTGELYKTCTYTFHQFKSNGEVKKRPKPYGQIVYYKKNGQIDYQIKTKETFSLNH